MRLRSYLRANVVVSAAVHSAVLLALLGVWRSVKLEPTRRPGVRQGVRPMLVYNVGGAPASESTLRAAAAPVKIASRTRPAPGKTAPVVSENHQASAGPGGSGQSALGDGNITIALVRFHPRPAPDLSALPTGTAGDVVLDATIDAQGKIAGLKVTKGFGGAIDQTVIATVQQWTFAPATKDGVPVPSEQEILFHYERS